MPHGEWLKQQKIVVSQSGSQKSEIKMCIGLVPPEGCEEKIRSRPLLVSRDLASMPLSLHRQCGAKVCAKAWS